MIRKGGGEGLRSQQWLLNGRRLREILKSLMIEILLLIVFEAYRTWNPHLKKLSMFLLSPFTVMSDSDVRWMADTWSNLIELCFVPEEDVENIEIFTHLAVASLNIVAEKLRFLKELRLPVDLSMLTPDNPFSVINNPSEMLDITLFALNHSNVQIVCDYLEGLFLGQKSMIQRFSCRWVIHEED